ncbi:hypothetical protein HETIRDRAFT_410744 [Heterobasidion irregulare TC 32-1]|uniref:Mitochondrial carrier protein n=1 Tax=Heterobasidion irregulare (strain TC 32-1) TaxID=747525 RepID=W4K154_HETIT|nr:uncharacterized protein HETIRDRAFT_410744 [Heterobasidion irregulare TC 32-1]ETW78801.1 hypothetical protein HETIRDRAFT_410744 [Heterobasidion irregulare TC 32-1]
MITAFAFVSVLAVAPLHGALVRYRVNYVPKTVRLLSSDDERGGQPEESSLRPHVPGFFRTLGRVKKIEGWAGMYKGIMPRLMAPVVAMLLVNLITLGVNGSNGFNSPGLIWRLPVLILIMPLIILINRSIITPYRLPFFGPTRSLRIILSDAERRAPWILFLTPGLLIAQALQVSYAVGLVYFRRTLMPNLTISSSSVRLKDISPMWPVLFVGVALLSTLVLTPLEVIAARVSVQPNFTASEPKPAPGAGTEADIKAVGALYNPDEDVIRLRGSDEMDPGPYTGFIDCGKRIIIEEGWRTLYRGWWITLIACLSAA